MEKAPSAVLDLAELAAALMESGMAITITIEPSEIQPEKKDKDESKRKFTAGEWDALMGEVFFESQTSNSIGGGAAVAASGILQGPATP
jgi:hypothetical protein